MSLQTFVSTPVLLLLGYLSLSGCAATTDPGRLVPDFSIAAVKLHSPLHGNLALGEVRGEQELGVLGTYRVGSQELAEALSRSLRGRGLLVGPERPAPYRLTAYLADASLGSVGYDITGRILVRYVLRDTAGAVVLDELVRSSHTVTFAQEFFGLT
jgi:hypothetical protein